MAAKFLHNERRASAEADAASPCDRHVEAVGSAMNRDPAPTKVDPLKPEQAAALDRDGYLLLRGAVPAAWRDALRAAFESGVGTGDQWAAPGGPAGDTPLSI
jgi:hypothetical protein